MNDEYEPIGQPSIQEILNNPDLNIEICPLLSLRGGGSLHRCILGHCQWWDIDKGECLIQTLCYYFGDRTTL